MIEDKIEIVIPTYNRANYLDKTLSYILNSPFKNCKITIRDNASSDDTPKICEKYSELFKNLNIIRNRKNIGGNANIWRSYEQATYPYVWVLADNDYLNFDNSDDFIEAIESEKYDLIICCSAEYTSEDSPNFLPTPDDEPISEYMKRKKNSNDYLENTTKELALLIEKHYFIISTFIPSTIYKTSLIDSEILINGYDYICQSYPHYSLIAKALNNNLLTYKTKKDIVFVRPNPNDWEISPNDWYTRYLECSLLIEDKQIQTFATETRMGGIIYNLTSNIITAKILQDKNLKKNVLSMIKTMYQLKGWYKGLLYHIYILMCYSVPKKICDIVFKIKQNKD